MAGYDHVQRAGAVMAVFLIGIFLCGVALAVALTSARVPVQVVLILVATIAVLSVVAWMFRSLRVTVRGREIVVAFGSGWPRRRIDLRKVESATPVRNALRYGFGIRFTPHGWLWNIGGLDAVELSMRGGSRFRIGTDDPDGLLDAIEAAWER